MAALKFATFSSEIELPFYSALFASKLEHDKLSDSARPVLGVYQPRPGAAPDDSVKMQVLANALTSRQVPANAVRGEGTIRNMNTLDAFKNADRNEMLRTAARTIWEAIKDGTIYEIPSLLSHFILFSYADLKKYRMTYWFCFATLHSDPQWKRTGEIGRLTASESTDLVDRVGTWRYSVDDRQYGFFLAKKLRGKEAEMASSSLDMPSEEDTGFRWDVGSLRDFETGFFDGVPDEDRYVAFVDPSTYEEHPAWPLRNLLVLVRQRFHLTKVQVLCYREIQARRHEARSIILPLSIDPVDNLETSEMPKVVGWERNPAGKLSPRSVSLAESMDPARIADQSVDLNLKLMKWRIAPDLNLEAIKDTKCLLLGAGTLGSYVSRNLMGWGVRKITFVDYGAVSFSNPVRQPLFTYKDCLNGGAPKATQAAQALKEIFPGVESEGHVLSVPMLGHPVSDKTQADFERLKALIDDHDAIFLLMDSRESRWLPTVMGKAAGKIVMNAALGFDTYVVMRHGVEPTDSSEKTLGCYFCNDVFAPGDSQKDLTLDQQCTVTRPGIAAIASALIVELLVSLLQHPLKAHAPAPVATGKSGASYERDPPDHALGLVPHQVRGFLAEFRNIIIKGESYSSCSACSNPILSAYKSDGWTFLQRALEDKEYVTELSGLAEVRRQGDARDDEMDWDEEEEGENGGDDEAVII
ncbi:E1-like activating enzyme [Pseudomassariella vexata]|uniref:Ubiquitin-like modifier-activating enzyme ATG7 n=1 Tax=Pseudomassariella vexata TaxID=1141098 RepID=A0A1Y2E0H0_9PEZI|nr:E1-like activating enzyme [Pseudomassariella vexata]ORY64969.1 E1-like activating enzyme [Pseudomassariella vexata]